MLKRAAFFLWFFMVAGCIEPYEFVIHDDDPSLVIEAFIADRSFNETLSYPSDGRYFTVKLSQTGDVTNRRPEPVTGATVELLDSESGSWLYIEEAPGLFKLADSDFKAEAGIRYKLRIVLADEAVYESAWETLPSNAVPPMGDISFAETEKQMYAREANKWVLRTFAGVMTNVRVTENITGRPIRYRWTYSPTWIYKAPLSSVVDPGHICWATDPFYLNTYALQTDRSGGYAKDLFFIRTIRNERIFEKFSVLVTQHAMTEPYYNFWKEMKDQNEGSSLNDTPPYDLATNYVCITDGEKRVSGYFGVVCEQAQRWYFSREGLSYNVVNTLKADCLIDYGPGPPALECTDCRGYSFGKATTEKPVWWQDD